MGQVVTKFLSGIVWPKRQLAILMLGLDNAGTVLNLSFSSSFIFIFIFYFHVCHLNNLNESWECAWCFSFGCKLSDISRAWGFIK